MVGLGSSWGPACGHPVQPGAQFCDVCGQPYAPVADGGSAMPTMTTLGPASTPPPPSPASRQAWPAPPPEIHQPPINPDQADDPWASWYGPKRPSQDSPSATLPRVTPAPGPPGGSYDAQGYGPGPGYGPDQGYAGGPQGSYAGPDQGYAGGPQGSYGGPDQGYAGGPQGSYGGPDQGYSAAPTYAGSAAPTYGGGPQYGGSPQQWAGPQDPGGPQGGGPQYPGQPYGGPQQYPDGGYQGPMAGGPQSMGYAGTQQYDPRYGTEPLGAAPPYGPDQYGDPGAGQRPGLLGSLRSRGPLIPALAIGAAAVIAVVALVLANGSSGGSPNATAATSGTTGSTTGSSAQGGNGAAEQTAAVALNKLLAQSGKYRAEVNAALGHVEACKSLRASRDAFGASASNRKSLLAQLAVLPDRSALPAGMLSDLTTGWQASVQVDSDFQAWAQDEMGGGCNPKTVTSDPHYQASNPYENPASSGKAEFAQAWKPIAAKFGLPEYTQYQL